MSAYEDVTLGKVFATLQFSFVFAILSHLNI